MDEDRIQQLVEEAFYLAPYPNPNFPPSVYYRFLRKLVEYKKPQLSVELGVCGGGGSLHLCLGNSGIVVGVDNQLEYPENIAFIEKRFKNFVFRQDDSISSASEVYRDFGRIDILFIDTIHTYERTMKEFNYWFPFLSENAVVCLDDLLRKEMAGVWEDLPGKKLRADELHQSQEGDGGFGIIYNIKG